MKKTKPNTPPQANGRLKLTRTSLRNIRGGDGFTVSYGKSTPMLTLSR